MPDVKREALIVHGRSDSYESFQPLKNLLVAAGYQTTQAFLGTYASIRDDVTFVRAQGGATCSLRHARRNPR
jgi:hypothetical protein